MSFKTDLEIGKRGEKIVIDTLKNRNHNIIDVSDDWNYRRQDIDYIITNKENQTTTLEIKNDVASERTGNVFVETYNEQNTSHSNKGWFFYCRANHICFLQEKSRKAHFILFEDLKTLIDGKKYREAFTANTTGLLVPIGDIKKLPSYLCIAV